jgi:sec-independent protein translocase protein TatC
MPMWILFEVGLVFARVVSRNRASREDDDGYDDEDGGLQRAGAAAAAGSVPVEEGAFEPLDERQMEDEFDRIEREFDELEAPGDEDEAAPDTTPEESPRESSGSDAHDGEVPAPAFSEGDSADMLDEETEFPQRSAVESMVDAKLEQVVALRATGALGEARRLLYEVLADGSETQVRVARNILEQLDN